MDKRAIIFIAGHGDVIERSLVSYFLAQGFSRVFSSQEMRVDLLNPLAVRVLFEKEAPDYVILTSVRSGGIGANQVTPAEFIYENLQAQNNVIHTACQRSVKKLLFVAASCVYPKDCPQPMKEEYFLSGSMEKTSEPYSVAKAAGIIMCQAYHKQYGFKAIAAIPATVYGPKEGKEAQSSHVMGALIAKFRRAVQEKAKSIDLWGTGDPKREFIYADDFASACHFLLEKRDGGELVNIGTSEDVSIKSLAGLIRDVSGYDGEIRWDTTRPDGAMRKLLDSSQLLSMGWKAKVSLKEGVHKVYANS